MSSNGDGRAHLVHEARKTIKRMRALARLLRRETGEQEFHRVNDALREAARTLAGSRDATVLAATLRELGKHDADLLASEPIAALAARLQAQAACAEETHAGRGGGGRGSAAKVATGGGDDDYARGSAAAKTAVGDGGGTGGESNAETDAAVLETVGRMRGELLRWNLLQHEPDALAEGLRLIYRDGRRRYKRAKRGHGEDPQRMHDWRKRVKALYYALDMLGGKHTAATAKLTRRADKLGELLGSEHDLWMLAVHVEQEKRLPQDARVALGELIERRRKRLRRRALALGADIYRHKSARFVKRAGAPLTG